MRQMSDYRTRVLWLAVAACLLSAELARANFAFGDLTNLGSSINGSRNDLSPCLSTDGLSLFFSSDRGGGSGSFDLWVAERENTNAEWGAPRNLGATVNSAAIDIEPCISYDGLELYFESRRPGSIGGGDIWVTTRETTDNDWGVPVNLGNALNSGGGDGPGSISPDGLELHFYSSRVGGNMDLYVTRRTAKSDAWGLPVNLGAVVNTSAHEWCPVVSTDGLLLLFARGPQTTFDIWMATRTTVLDTWSDPTRLAEPLNGSHADAAFITASGLEMFIDSDRQGGHGSLDIWRAPIIPVTDFSGDGAVDGRDVLVMTNSWGTDDSLCDIGPMPWGDGIVDVADLIVLAEYIGKDVDDPTLIAHWTFDETEGDMAYESTSGNDATLVGAATWCPEEGAIGGALELDGVGACVETPELVDPGDGSLSILAWVKGGAPGQVMISQFEGANWLSLDAANGCLVTELKGAGRDARVLCSEVPVADGNWHRIALIYEGDHRSLYVGDLLAAQDTQAGGPASCSGGLHIGCGADQAPGSFFSGLIDDVRIYNRVVRP